MDESLEQIDGVSLVPDSELRERHQLGRVLIPLMKGVVYKVTDPARWESLLVLQPRVLDHVSVLGLTMILNEAEGYAFLRTRQEEDEREEMPRLVTRRPLSFPVSLLLVLLRKRLVEFDVTGGETRLVLTRAEIVDMLRLFMSDTSNEAKLIDQVDTHINKVIQLGFVRKLKSSSTDSVVRYEVKRIIRSFVDAQWLSEFDKNLEAYKAQLLGDEPPEASITLSDTPTTTASAKPVASESDESEQRSSARLQD